MSLALQRNARRIAGELRPALTNTEVHITFDGFDLVVRGDYTPSEPESLDSPGEREDFDVTEIYLADSAIDISALFGFHALELAILEKLRTESEPA